MIRVLHGIYILLYMLLLCNTGYTQTNTQAQTASHYLQENIDSILTILRNPQWNTKEGQSKLYPELRTRVQTLFDFRIISSQIVGTKWESFTPEEQEQCIEAFTHILEYTYSSSFTNYAGQSVRIEHSRTNKAGTQAEITTKIRSSDGKETTVVYRLMDTQHGWKVYNIIVENINLIASYKTQLKELLLSSSPREIVEKLQNQASTLSAQK